MHRVSTAGKTKSRNIPCKVPSEFGDGGRERKGKTSRIGKVWEDCLDAVSVMS